MADHVPGHDVAVEIPDEEPLRPRHAGEVAVVVPGHPAAGNDLVRVILGDGIMPQLRAVAVQQAVAHQHLVLAVAVHVHGQGAVAGVGGADRRPQYIQLIVQRPDPAVAVLDEDIRGPRKPAEVADADAVGVQAGEGIGIEGRADEHVVVLVGDGGFRGALDAPGAAVQDADLELPAYDHLVRAVPVNVVDLEGHVRRYLAQHLRLVGGLAQLPQHVALQVDGRQAADEAVGVPADPLLHLRQNDLPAAVPRQVAEADLPAGAEILQVDLLPQLHGGVAGHFRLLPLDGLLLPAADQLRLLHRDRRFHVRKTGGAIRRQGHLAAPLRQGNLHVDQHLPVHRAAHTAAVHVRQEPVVPVAVGGKGHLREHPHLLLVPPGQPRPIPALQAEHQGVDGVVHAKAQPRHPPQGQPPHRGGKGHVPPGQTPGLQGGEHTVGAVLFKAHALHRVTALLRCNEPGGAGAVPGVVAHLIHPAAVVARLRHILVLAHGGVIPVVGELPDGKATEILREQHMVLHACAAFPR